MTSRILPGASLAPGHVGPFAGLDVPWLLRLRAQTRRDHTFLIWAPFDAPARPWTYGEFHDRVGALAAGLVRRGIKPGDCVLIHLDNCIEMLLAEAAADVAGATREAEVIVKKDATYTCRRQLAQCLAIFLNRRRMDGASRCLCAVDRLGQFPVGGRRQRNVAILGAQGIPGMTKGYVNDMRLHARRFDAGTNTNQTFRCGVPETIEESSNPDGANAGVSSQSKKGRICLNHVTWQAQMVATR